MRFFKIYGIGFLLGVVLGWLYLTYVYWRAKMFPGDPELNRYFAYLRFGQRAE
jgi:hypothetical protein